VKAINIFQVFAHSEYFHQLPKKLLLQHKHQLKRMHTYDIYTRRRVGRAAQRDSVIAPLSNALYEQL